MQRTPPRSSRRGSVVFALTAAVALASTVVSLAAEAGPARARFDEARRLERKDASRSPGSGSLFARYQRARADLGVVSSLDVDRAEAASRLAAVLETVRAADQRRSPAGDLVASRLVEGVVDRVAADPALLDVAVVRDRAASTYLASVARPFAAERARTEATIARLPGRGVLPDVPLTRAAAGVAMTSADAVIDRMEAAALARDVEGCRAARRDAGVLLGPVLPGVGSCDNAVSVVRAGERLAGLRSRARSRAL